MSFVRYDLSPNEALATAAAALYVGQSHPGLMALDARTERACSVNLIERAPKTEWLYAGLESYARDVNRDFDFAIDGIGEPVQFITYREGDHIGWHMDTGLGSAASRKLSISLQLSAADEYAGGELGFPDGSFHPFARRFGATICFPSYVYHRVSPVTRGVRRALVAWIHGAPFK